MQELEAQQAELRSAANRYAEVRAWLETFEHSMYTDATSIDGLVIKALVEQILVYLYSIAPRNFDPKRMRNVQNLVVAFCERVELMNLRRNIIYG